MIKASELRIGNLITKGESSLWNVAGILGETIFSGGFQLPISEFEPIPLTEEWLLKFGFESIGELHPTYRKAPYVIENNLMRTMWHLRQLINKEDSLCLTVTSPLEYVHQLQNLYFALTGKELELVKEETLG